MIDLRIHENGKNYDEELRQQIEEDLLAVRDKISRLYVKKKELEMELLNFEISPFKIGDYALVNITVCGYEKWRKCLLEYHKGVLYARPVNKDGSLSSRHYSLLSITKTYVEQLREVEE